MNLLTKFHEHRTVNVASRVLTRFYYSQIRKNAPPLGSHFFQANIIIFELIQDIIETNLLIKFNKDWTINVACRVLTSHVTTKTIFELIQDIIGTNLLTKFYDDRKINVTSRVLTRKIASPLNQPASFFNSVFTRKNASPLGSHVFKPSPSATHQHHQPTGIIFELVQDIIGMNLLTKFHEDWTINVASRKKNAPPLGSHVFQAKVTIFELIQDISGTNLLSKFHEDRKINVASRVLTRFYYSHIRKNAPPLGCHVFQTNLLTKFHEDWTINMASRAQNIIGTNLLTKFHEDHKINVASRKLTRKNAPPPGSHVFQPTGIIF
ncbi:hypothetical protein DPMN_000886 [Dreissena polymorpha]|uniref:Uncharacterized protein n=1 Tax=Dreissena polymorpha TaxID=45954 RepID=A0A9D4MKM5_DREPO|nr:hypothetical protein DPMN_000886 [Dreissena polymorpha]